MSKLRVGVIFGGMSSEYEISLKSVVSVINSIPKDRYEIVCVGITKKGRMLYYPGSIDLIENDEWYKHSDCVTAVISPDRSHTGLLKLLDDGTYSLLKLDCVFPVLHGRYGEDGCIQGLLAMSGIPYVGCDTYSSSVCMDKDATHALTQAAGIKSAKWISIRKSALADLDQICSSLESELGMPIFVKPANTGSSVGISKAKDKAQLREAIKIAFTHDDKVVAEECIEGIEAEIAVMGTTENPIVSEVGQIIPANEFYDYDAKYNNALSKTIIPAKISPEKRAEIAEIAAKTYKILGCRGLSRIDFFVTPAGEIYLNEVNTMPGFTNISMFGKLFEYSGIPYPELLERLIEIGMVV
ncbi:MAG: D-alanine--D-alanine ligase [Oscillospiraceae bacterium]|nr:D-alanine--D-alanine ligase [Oscillospiraceae bacterium]